MHDPHPASDDSRLCVLSELIDSFHQAFRDYIHEIHPSIHSRNSVAIEIAKKTDIAVATLLKVYDGQSVPYPHTIRKILTVYPMPSLKRTDLERLSLLIFTYGRNEIRKIKLPIR